MSLLQQYIRLSLNVYLNDDWGRTVGSILGLRWPSICAERSELDQKS